MYMYNDLSYSFDIFIAHVSLSYLSDVYVFCYYRPPEGHIFVAHPCFCLFIIINLFLRRTYTESQPESTSAFVNLYEDDINIDLYNHYS